MKRRSVWDPRKRDTCERRAERSERREGSLWRRLGCKSGRMSACREEEIETCARLPSEKTAQSHEWCAKTKPAV
jgi:hypothetical protein